MVDQDKCSKALLFASIRHEGQKMLEPDVSYVTHLQGVCVEAVTGCLNSKENVDLEKVILLSLLHDTIEDTSTTYEEILDNFGKDIADGVLALSKNMNLDKEMRMIDSLRRIKKLSKEVAIVKMSDRIFNLKDVPEFWDDNKINTYKEEAKLILNELGDTNEYMAKRLKKKIESYRRD